MDNDSNIKWTVEGQMLHRVAKRMEQEEERERIRGMRKLDCGCSVSNVELYYHDDREKSICEGCLQDRIAIGDDPNLEWYEIEEGDIEGYGELWTWQAGQQIPDWTPDHDIIAWANQEKENQVSMDNKLQKENQVFDCGHGPALFAPSPEYPSGQPLTYYFYDHVWGRTYCAHCGNHIVTSFTGTHNGRGCEPVYSYGYTDTCLELETMSLRKGALR